MPEPGEEVRLHRPRRSVAHATPTRLRFAKAIRLAREAAGLTQTDVEARTGIPRTTLSDIERGKHNLTIDMIDRLAAAVGTPVHVLLEPR